MAQQQEDAPAVALVKFQGRLIGALELRWMLEGAGINVRVVPDDKANEWYLANPYASTTLRGGNSQFTRILFLVYGKVDSGLTGEAAFMAAAAVVKRARRKWSGRWVFENRPIKERGKWPIKLRRRYVAIEPCDLI